MGCFKHKGNFSNLPIAYGDRIVVIVGVRPTEKMYIGQELDSFSPGYSFIPISVPIRGEYDDYGGIENIDRTPAIDKLEKFFGMETTKLVKLAERTCYGCEDQMEDEDEIAKKVLKDILYHSGYSDRVLTLTYIMEHEKIFDHIVSIANPKKKDKYFWRIPHKYIETLGYKKNQIGEENAYPVIRWEHDTLPTLKEKCYVWLENDFNDLGKTSHTLTELCEKIGCDVPEEFEETFLESIFKKDCDFENSEKRDQMMFDYYRSFIGKTGVDGVYTEEKVKDLIEDYKKKTKEEKIHEFSVLNYFIRQQSKDDERYSFKRHGNDFGLFYHRTGIDMSKSILSQFGFYEEHLKPEYMKEVVETAALIDGLQILELTWGVTNYHRQDVDYNQHLNFLEKCIEVVKEKQTKKEE
jgi:hypothetical protein